jgi:hypothetical protein
MSYLDKKGYHTWTYVANKKFGGGLDNIEFRIDEEVSLDEIVEHFESYLKAVGFSFEGHLDFVYDEEI